MLGRAVLLFDSAGADRHFALGMFLITLCSHQNQRRENASCALGGPGPGALCLRPARRTPHAVREVLLCAPPAETESVRSLMGAQLNLILRGTARPGARSASVRRAKAGEGPASQRGRGVRMREEAGLRRSCTRCQE